MWGILLAVLMAMYEFMLKKQTNSTRGERGRMRMGPPIPCGALLLISRGVSI